VLKQHLKAFSIAMTVLAHAQHLT